MLGKVVWIILNVLLVLVGNVLLLVPEDSNSRTISTTFQEECVSYCPDLDLNQNRTNDTSSDVGCGVQCQMDQCTKGCGAWRRALDTSCQAVCNGTREILPPKVLYCVIGCHNALNRYFQQLKAEIGVPPAPALVADSLTATSLRLEWKGTDVEKYGAGISYLVQWRYEALAETWQYCRNQSWGEDDQILVENLQPYTKYRFRVALLLKSAQHNPEAIVSAPSVVILTLADGLPTSAPVIVRAAAVDSCRVSVSWEPGPFTNGPLLSYVLRLQGADHSQLKNIPASENTGHYMFQNLKPNKNYSISVTMRNGVGEGPAAVVHIATTPEPAVKDMQQPILILGGEHVVVQQGADMLDEPSFIYRTTSTIRGVAIHVATANLFVSDSMGYVYRMPIPRMDPIEASTGSSNVQSFDEHSKNHRVTEPTIILSPNEANFKPSSLSVDWLNLHLYVLGEVKHATTVWQIARCNLDGRGLTVATSGFLTKPSHIEVDPYNGYLFWVTRGGLYRLDLADISNGVKHEVQPFLILEDAHLGAFTVDHTNFRLLVPHHTENTVISVSLDGRELIDLRANTQQSKFKNVVSLAAANGLFYWTNGEEVLTEGYHPGQNRYFHNAYPDRFDGSFVSVNVLMNASQPVPVPVNPPTGVQAVLGTEKAKISWQAPHLLGGQGKGAWQNWSYELEIKDESTGEAIHPKNIAGSSHTVRKLSEGSEYSIKAAAYTSAGRGPWSSEFRGRTLRGESHASILWSSSEGLLKSDVTGENIDTLIYKASFKDYDNEYHIVDVSWYRDVLYVVGNNSALYKYNMTSHEKVKLNINSVGSVAVDWISKKLYWANPKQQIITRANLNGSQQEPMAILAIVKELVIDSLEGYLYWSSGHAVEVAHLNGQDRRYYHSDEIFNGKQVMGLTLDTENRFIYWIVRSYESGSIVFRAPTSENISMNQKIIPEKVSALQHPSIQGPLCYFSEHLLWLQDDKNAIIGDLSGQNTAIINGITLSGLYMVAVMDPALHRYPQNLSSDEIVVLPNSVNIETLRIEGTWRNFNISWDPIDNTNYGSVFYEVKFVDYINSNSNSEITTETTVPYNNSEQILPYSVLEVSVKAFTYWETANPTRKRLRSPESIPTQPINPRAYVDFHKDMLSDDKSYNIYVTFRWDTPEFPNGLILGYRIRCWYTTENGMEIHVCRDATVLSSEREYTIEKLTPNTRYYLQVQAYTKIGSGPYSDTINVTTDRENPIPRLVITTTNAVKLADLDYNTNYSITEYIAVDVTYLSADNRIYWINEMHELVTSTLDGLDASKMLSLNNTALCLCVDWVSRTLFWAELDGGTSRIVRFDLIQYDAGILKYRTIVSRNKRIASLIASPLTGSLYWVETTRDDEGIILQSDLFGENIRDFFNKSENCSCPQKQSVVRPSIAVDTNGTNKLYWISAEGSLNTASLDGCTCNTIMSTTFANGLPPTSLAVDKINIYWSNMATNSVYYIKKNDIATSGKDTPRYSTYYLPRVKEIETVGKSLQRYPPPDCLIPYQVTYDVEEESKTANSITVGLPQPVAHAGCENYSLPTTLYTIHVSQCLENNPNNCDDRDQMKLQTYDRRTVVSGLKPFTKYRFKLALSNYYSDLSSLSLEFNSGVILTTGAGAPTTPENVTVKSLTPNSAAVYWMPPKSLNAAAVRYEIHWTSLLVVDGIRQKGEQIVKDTGHISNETYMTILHPLQPNQAYMVYVRAYPTHFGGVFSESTGDIVRMYPEPNNLTLIGVTINSMNVSWEPTVNLTVAYTLQYQEVGAENWMVAKNTTGNETRAEKVVVYTIRNLQPKTMYKFRLLVKYPDYHKDYVWPTDSRFTFQTLGDVPSTPGVPVLMKLRNSVYQLNWEPAQAHGSQINLYRLVGIILNDQNSEQDNEEEVNDDEDQWIVYYNGTDNYWIIMGEMTQRYRFRVQARNDYGFGAWSKISDIVDLTSTSNEMLASQEHLGLVLGLSVPVITIMLLCFCCFLCLYKQRKEEKKAVLAPIVSDVELATLREIPRGNFVQSNTLYASTMQNYTDETALPKIRRDQITLAKFLGSGAFGEVYQGSAVGLGPGATPVAIKTLRKGASAQEKTEFLQEARLMSHFRHKHVLRLLGVCLDTDPPLLVLELMEAGDLLSYLRASRILQPTEPSALKLQDLLAMCEDVARGCRYLEELHFVHRDLACRNCLVSARDRENRVVKIGDFGLARDIYKNDYYRKEGEGLLPVRWMAPESLVDGVFTSQSDVWAFGVLMWEITSLGQQPYPARTNLEVLHHVRAGGRLPKPLNCPPALHQLMLLCWGRADARPSFKTCLDRIVTLRNNIEDSPLSPVHVSSYLARQGNSWKSSSSEGSRDMQSILQSFDSTTTILQSTDVPKYLELLADSENVSSDATSPTQGPIVRDNHLSGYEIPKPLNISDKKMDYQREARITPANTPEQTDNNQVQEQKTHRQHNNHPHPPHHHHHHQSNKQCTRKRSSFNSLNTHDRKLDAKNHFQRDSLTSLSDRSKYKPVDKRCLESRNCGSLDSISLTTAAVPAGTSTIRPTSSSLISAPKDLATENDVASITQNVVINNAVSKLNRSHSNLQNGKANIPLVINNALLNLLRQTQNSVVEDNVDNVDIVTYTNINSDTVRVNGS